MTIININDDNCWICGKKKQLTMHHTLPKHLNPKKNIIVPICLECHKKINLIDISSLISYTFKLEKTTKELLKQVKFLTNTTCNIKLIKWKNKTEKEIIIK